MGCNSWLQSPRHVFRVAVVSSLIQGCLYLALAVWGILLYSCTANTHNGTIASSYLIYLVYFTNKECGQPAAFQGFAGLWANPDAGNPVAELANSTLIAYAVVSSLWVATALLMCGALKGKTGLKTSPALYFPWVIVSAAVLVLDVYATVRFALDFSWVTNFNSLLKEINVIGVYSPSGIELEDTPEVATVVLMMVSCRFVLFWCVNLFLVFRVVQESMRFKRSNKRDHISERPTESDYRTGRSRHTLGRTEMQPQVKAGRAEQQPIVGEAGYSGAALTPLQVAAMQGFSYEKPGMVPVNRNTSITSKDETRLNDYRGSYLPHVAPQALRNQLPWSYFQERDRPVAATGPAHAGARKPDLEMPPVPVPDYTLHFGRQAARPGIQRHNSEMSSVSK